MITRRDLLRAGAVAGTGCLCLASPQSPRTCCITPELDPACITHEDSRLLIDLDRAPELRKTGSSANLIDQARGLDLIIVHPEPARFCTLAGLCTHYPRPLTYLPKRGVLQCNNFNHSTFALDGSVVKGPATRPIAAFPTSRKGRTLVVEL